MILIVDIRDVENIGYCFRLKNILVCNLIITHVSVVKVKPFFIGKIFDRLGRKRSITTEDV